MNSRLFRPLLAAALLMAFLLPEGVARAQASPPAPALSTAAADTLFVHRDWAGAEAAYMAVVGMAPALPIPWYRIGYSRAKQGHWSAAAAAFQKANDLGFAPNFGLYSLAAAFAHTGQVDSTFAVLNRALAAGLRPLTPIADDSDLVALHSDARFPVLLDRADRVARPCAFAPEWRQFDFWIGDWEVHNNRRLGAIAGQSHVELILNQCVIFEHWSAGAAGSGKSFNSWNVEKQCWQQNWMDDAGDVVNFTDGHYKDGVMQFVADKTGQDGVSHLQRLTFHNLGPDLVRQVGEHSEDHGKTWQLNYDFNYLRKKKV